jgi:hypothetical protein
MFSATGGMEATRRASEPREQQIGLDEPASTTSTSAKNGSPQARRAAAGLGGPIEGSWASGEGDGERRLGRGLHEQIVDRSLVLVGDVGSRDRQGDISILS